MTAMLKSTSEGSTMVLTLSNPGLGNALSPEIYAAGIEALNAADSNPEIRSVIITGEGSSFCAGGDLRRLQALRSQDPETQGQAVDGLHNWIDSIRTFPKPVIAAVEGAAAGAGFSLALAADFIVAADTAFFLMAYSNVGLSPDGGGSWALARALPHPLVARTLMLGERLSAAQLQTWGLVNQVTPQGHAMTAALQLAQMLNERAPNVLSSIKELMNEAPGASLVQQLDSERGHFVRNLRHSNSGEGIEAFLEKRLPRFS
jgi:enoyl-CoA hydratase/carnithine racemase